MELNELWEHVKQVIHDIMADFGRSPKDVIVTADPVPATHPQRVIHLKIPNSSIAEHVVMAFGRHVNKSSGFFVVNEYVFGGYWSTHVVYKHPEE